MRLDEGKNVAAWLLVTYALDDKFMKCQCPYKVIKET